jgi:hypothetical protein
VRVTLAPVSVTELETAKAAGATARLRIAPVLLGLFIAAVTVGLQIWLKITSRDPPRDKRHGLAREDLVWWLDWVVAAVVAFSILALSTAHSHGSLDTTQVVELFVCFGLGLSGVPGLVRNWGYDKSHNPPALKTLMGIVVPNLLGAVILMAAVASGARLAG